MSTSERPAQLPLTMYDERAYERVVLDLFDRDGMFKGNLERYLAVGASGLNCIQACQRLSNVESPRSILDFGCGAGRVMRWICAAYPDARLSGAELQTDALHFCAQTFGAETWLSNPAVEELQAPSTYDLIWAGSVVTHISAEKTEALIQRFVSWLNPKGLIVASAHGRFAYSRRVVGKYISDTCLPAIEDMFERKGYGYSAHPGGRQYGISFLKPEWILALVSRVPNCRLVTYSEQAWDQHHDIFAIQKS